MALRIWETDPESEPKPRERFANDLVGRFRSGFQINNRPATLTEWRVTTGDPEVADAIQKLLGGDEPQAWETAGEDNLEVFTKAPRVRVIVHSPKALRSEMVLWGRSGAIRKCDGVVQHGDGDEGKACECPQSYQDRKDAAKSGKGCAPSVTLFFCLADAPELGKWKFNSGSWTLVRDLGQVEAALAAIDGPAYAWLGLEVVEYQDKKSGANRRFTKPVVEIIGPVPKEDDDAPPF